MNRLSRLERFKSPPTFFKLQVAVEFSNESLDFNENSVFFLDISLSF
jgi:hypothetical protein